MGRPGLPGRRPGGARDGGWRRPSSRGDKATNAPPVDAALRSLDDEQLATFLRGLVIGAFVGGAIAGSRIWARIRNRSHRSPS